MENVPETIIPDQDSEELETAFRALTENDSITVYVRAAQNTYYKYILTVTSVNQDTTATDDTVHAKTANGDVVTLRLNWYAPEPSVGIRNTYSEGPIQLEHDENSYDLVALA